jgi:hypothetical protein
MDNSELIKSGISLFAFTVPALIGSIIGLKIKSDRNNDVDETKDQPGY